MNCPQWWCDEYQNRRRGGALVWHDWSRGGALVGVICAKGDEVGTTSMRINLKLNALSCHSFDTECITVSLIWYWMNYCVTHLILNALSCHSFDTECITVSLIWYLMNYCVTHLILNALLCRASWRSSWRCRHSSMLRCACMHTRLHIGSWRARLFLSCFACYCLVLLATSAYSLA